MLKPLIVFIQKDKRFFIWYKGSLDPPELSVGFYLLLFHLYLFSKDWPSESAKTSWAITLYLDGLLCLVPLTEDRWAHLESQCWMNTDEEPGLPLHLSGELCPVLDLCPMLSSSTSTGATFLLRHWGQHLWLPICENHPSVRVSPSHSVKHLSDKFVQERWKYQSVLSMA